MNMHHRIFRRGIVLLLAIAVQGATAQELAPDELVRTVTQDVISVVKGDKAIQAGDRKKTIALVEEKVLPHFNFTRMTALALGVNWRKATPEQQKAVVDEFRTLLVNRAEAAGGDVVIEVLPPRAKQGDTEVAVRSVVKQPGGEPVTIDYSMEKTPAGWKVYDVAIGGVSLVTTYRDAFANEVRNGGIDGLIKSLAEKNRQLEMKRG